MPTDLTLNRALPVSLSLSYPSVLSISLSVCLSLWSGYRKPHSSQPFTLGGTGLYFRGAQSNSNRGTGRTCASLSVALCEPPGACPEAALVRGSVPELGTCLRSPQLSCGCWVWREGDLAPESRLHCPASPVREEISTPSHSKLALMPPGWGCGGPLAQRTGQAWGSSHQVCETAASQGAAGPPGGCAGAAGWGRHGVQKPKAHATDGSISLTDAGRSYSFPGDKKVCIVSSKSPPNKLLKANLKAKK